MTIVNYDTPSLIGEIASKLNVKTEDVEKALETLNKQDERD